MWLHISDTSPSPERLLQSLNLDYSPIQIVQLARSLGIEPFFVESVDWMGALEASTETGETNIYVHRDLSEERQRLLIAYHIGYLMYSGPSNRKDKWDYTLRTFNLVNLDDNEAQVRQYAHDLLMPPTMTHSIVTHTGIDVCAISHEYYVPVDEVRRCLERRYVK